MNYRLNVIPQNVISYRNNSLRIHMESQYSYGSTIARMILSEKNKARPIRVSHLRGYFKAMIIKTAWDWHKK